MNQVNAWGWKQKVVRNIKPQGGGNLEDLVLIRNNKAVCTSLQVAEKFERKHKNVIKSIENLLEMDSAQKLAQWFSKGKYKDSSGKENPIYYMNRDGFTVLVMGFNGKKALEWKIKYINAFNTMEEILRERNTQLWIDTRQNNKENRLKETDVIKLLQEYAKEQGSTHSDKLYMVYTKLANTVINGKRDNMGVSGLNNLTLVESIILQTIQAGMSMQMYYKDIYKVCKDRIEKFMDIAYLTA